MKKHLILVVICCCVLLLSFRKLPSLRNEVSYPDGYRNWTHIKSMIITSSDPKFDHSRGYHHIYANDKALEGYQTGKFPNGAIIVADFFEMIEKDGTILEGKRKFLDVMIKDSLLYKTTGNWGYEEFDGDSKTLRVITQANAATKCFNCHTSQETKNYIFSSYRE